MNHFSAFELIQCPIWIYDFERKSIIWANSASLEFWEEDKLSNLINRNIKSTMSLAVEATLSQYRELVEQGESIRTWWTFNPNCISKRGLCQFSGIELEDGRTGMLVHVLSEEESLLHDIDFSMGGNLSLLFDKHGKLVSYSKAFDLMFGSSNLDLGDLINDSKFAHRFLVTAQADGELNQEIDTVINGKKHYFEVNANWLDERKQLLLKLTDITRCKQQLFDAKFNASHDYLTGLLNRRGMIEQLSELVADNKEFHLVFLDLDEFKSVNDTYGHIAGDQLLHLVAERLTSHFGMHAQIARFGGDEFVLAANVEGYPTVEPLLQQIVATISQEYLLNDIGELSLSCSIGACCFPLHGTDIESLIKQSSIAMHHAKHQGRNRYQLYCDELTNGMHRKARIKHRMSKALEAQEFELHYQPIWDSASNKLYGAEALLRWNDSELGFIGPDEFIPIAEETGKIVELGAWVLEKAIAQQAKWLSQNNQPFVVSVNVSQIQLNSSFSNLVAELLCKYQLPAQSLAIELTESCMMQRFSDVQHYLNDIVELGVHLYLDDFGTGYSSLSVLQDLPLSKVKLDKSFIESYHQHSHTIVQATLSMCHSLNVEVIAEGVETDEQKTNLCRCGYRYLQGYLFSKPLKVEDFEQKYFKFVVEA
ncbi:EAL domain-containing protein [Vibrio sp. SCSIO 43136]|uniref:putative bifunctional diguanylate cyclase/phosphodiesterase n=1 Tax=Vibrio sp. SCSIO 43136 TaxID=2819101 RepID=UPI002074DF0C|nr:EAL domain-containing protein [Vibrio sp. SCSIO 43136]USD63960.1 EAL domain-containing protein [Vibrio sp. SCSIO 43136]